MAKPQIRIEQAGKPAGVAGQAREDLAVGVQVTFTAVGAGYTAYRWTLIDAPPAADLSGLSAATITDSTSVTAALTPDNPHTYDIQLEVDSGAGIGADPELDVASITFACGLPAETGSPLTMSLRRPAFREEAVHNAPTILYPAGNPKGWKYVMDRWFYVVDYLRSTKATAGQDGLMSKEYAEKLDGIQPFAAALTSAAPVAVTRAAAIVGVATLAARADHKHDIAEAASGTYGVLRLTGDLAGTGANPTVARINGATVPAAGALTTGYVLMVSGASALSYAQITDSSIAPTAAIGVTKLTTGGSNQILASNGTVNAWTTMTAAIHGNLGGGVLHAVVSNAGAGFAPQINIAGAGFLGTSNGVSASWQTSLDISLIAPGATADRALTTNGTTASWTQITNAMLAGSITWNKLTGYPTITTTAPLTIAGGASADLSTNRTLAIANATTTTVGVLQLAGDLGGTGTAPSVDRIHGATVPIAGALTTGHVLQVSGASALTYGQIGNSSIASNAAIAVTKLAVGGANQILSSNGVTNAWSAMTDPLHGNLGGGALHAVATNLINGFLSSLPGAGTTALLGTTNGTSQAWITKIGNIFIQGGSTADRVLSTDGTNANWTQVTNAMLAGSIAWSKLTGYPTVTTTNPLGVNGGVSATLSGNITLTVNTVGPLTPGVVPTINQSLALLGTANGLAAEWLTSFSGTLVADGTLPLNKLPLGTANYLLTSTGSGNLWASMTAAMHGGQSDGTLHAVVSGSRAGFAPILNGTNVVLRSTDGVNVTWGTIVAAMVTSVNWSAILNTPTTLSGYGITDGVGGSGTINYVPKWTASRTLGNSQIYDSGTTVTIAGSFLFTSTTANIGFASPGPGQFNMTGMLHCRGILEFFTAGGDSAGTTGIRANPNGYSVLNPNGTRFVMPVNVAEATTTPRGILTIERSDNAQPLLKLNSNGSLWTSNHVAFSPNSTLPTGADAAILFCGGQTGGMITADQYGSYNIAPDAYDHSTSRRARWHRSTGCFSITGSVATETISFSTTIHGQPPPAPGVQGSSIVGTLLIGWIGNGHLTNSGAQLFVFTVGLTSAGAISTFNVGNATTGANMTLLPAGVSAIQITPTTFGGTFGFTIRAANASATDKTRCIWEAKYGWGDAV